MESIALLDSQGMAQVSERRNIWEVLSTTSSTYVDGGLKGAVYSINAHGSINEGNGESSTEYRVR